MFQGLLNIHQSVLIRMYFEKGQWLKTWPCQKVNDRKVTYAVKVNDLILNVKMVHFWKSCLWPKSCHCQNVGDRKVIYAIKVNDWIAADVFNRNFLRWMFAWQIFKQSFASFAFSFAWSQSHKSFEQLKFNELNLLLLIFFQKLGCEEFGLFFFFTFEGRSFLSRFFLFLLLLSFYFLLHLFCFWLYLFFSVFSVFYLSFHFLFSFFLSLSLLFCFSLYLFCRSAFFLSFSLLVCVSFLFFILSFLLLVS